MVDKLIKTINQNRKVKSSINPKASIRSSNVISSSTIYIKDRPEVIEELDITEMAVWDNPQTTWDGADTNDEWDSYDSTQKTMTRVMNKNNTFSESFDYTFFQGDNNTATWDTTNRDCDFTSGQVCEIVSAFKDSSETNTVVSATLNVTVDSGSFDYEMSPNGGLSWDSVSLNVENTFTYQGSDLRIRITENNASTGTISNVRCRYNFGSLISRGAFGGHPTLSTGIISYWALEDTSDSVGSNTLTNSGATSGATGILSNCYSFDGINDCMNNTGSSLVSAAEGTYSVSAWIKPTALPSVSQSTMGGANSDAYIVLSSNTAFVNNYMGLIIESGVQKVVINRQEQNVANNDIKYTYTTPTSTWTHLCMTYNSATGAHILYVNGSNVASGTTSGNGAGGNVGTGISIGALKGSSSTESYCPGLADEIGVWSKVLTPSEVTDLYNSGAGLGY